MPPYKFPIKQLSSNIILAQIAQLVVCLREVDLDLVIN